MSVEPLKEGNLHPMDTTEILFTIYLLFLIITNNFLSLIDNLASEQS